MRFETTIIRTIDLMKTKYGKLSALLFVLSSLIMFFKYDTKYIYNLFGENGEIIFWLTLIIYLNGIYVVFISRMIRIRIGLLRFLDTEIEILSQLKETKMKIKDLDSIIFRYNGNSKKWNNWIPGEINSIEIIDKQKDRYSFCFSLKSDQHKIELIDSLVLMKSKGVEIKIDYKKNLGSYFSDKDFELVRKA